MSTEQTINPATPHPTLASFLLTYFAQLPITAVLLVILWLTLAFIPEVRDIFRSFRTSLPSVSEALLALADISSRGWLLLLLPALMLLPLPAALAARKSPDRRGQTIAILLSLLLQSIALAIFLALAILGLMFPLVKLIQSLTATP